jgi:hypothetical protein
MTESVAPFGTFHATLTPAEIAEGRSLQLRTLATWAFIYLLPGFLFVRQRSEFIQGWEMAANAGAALDTGVSAGAVGVAGAPALGSWMMLPNLTDEHTQTVLPMNDSLYGAAHVELDRLGPIVITVPENLPDGRYYSVALLDAFMNNFAHLGPKWTGDGPGEHLLVGPGWREETPAWATSVIRSPTVSAVLYHRALVGYEPGDIDRVRAWRQGFRLTPLARRYSPGPANDVRSEDLIHGDLRSLGDPFEFFRIAVDHLRHNPPPREDAWLATLLTQTRFSDLTDEHERDAVRDGVRDAQRILDAAISSTKRRNGWDLPFAHTAEQGPYVLEHAITQLRAIGSNDPAEAVYLFTDRDTDGAPLDTSGGIQYELCFEAGEMPPLEKPGFWSLTIYKASDGLLVPNPHHRYSTRISRPGFQREADGSARIAMSATPPRDLPDANWLPAPADEPFLLGLRLYYPAQPIRDRVWFPPPIRPVSGRL